MRAKHLVMGLACVSALALSACGTIVDGGSQKVDVIVKGSPRAFCTFTTSVYRNDGHFPNTVILERSREDIQADCTGEQNRHVTFIVPSHLTTKGTLGNIGNGLLPGTAYDAASGGLWAYPNPLIVDFREIGEGPKPEWPTATVDDTVDATRVGTAAITPPKPVRAEPIVDADLDPALPAQAMIAPAPTVTQTPIVDAVRIAVDKKAATPMAPIVDDVTVKSAPTPVTAAATSKGKVKPILSPEDAMGLEPGKVKAAEDAKKKAEVDAAAKKRAAAARKAAEAKKASEAQASEAEEKATVQTLPEATTTPPAEPVTTTPEPAAAATPTPAATPAEPAAAATTTTTTTTPATAEKPATTTTTTTTTPAATGTEPKSDMDKYLEGGR